MMASEAGGAQEAFTEEEEARIAEMARDERLVAALVENVCPNVWGHEDHTIAYYSFGVGK